METHDAVAEARDDHQGPPEALSLGAAFAQMRNRLASELDVWSIAATFVVASSAIATGLLTSAGGLFTLDIQAQMYGVGQEFWTFIWGSNKTHLSPGARTVDWLMLTFAPFQHWPAVLISVGLMIGLGTAAWPTLRTVIKRPLVALWCLFWVLFTPALVPTVAWFRQALTTIPSLIVTFLLIGMTIRYVRQPSWGMLVRATLCAAIGLSFSERSLTAPLVVMATALALGNGTLRARASRGALLATPMAMVNVAFLSLYMTGDYDHAARSAPSFEGFMTTMWHLLYDNALPSLLGGPLAWENFDGTPYSWARTPGGLKIVAALAFFALVLLSLRKATLMRIGSVSLVALAHALPVAVMVYVGRVSTVDTVKVVNDLRLFPDTTVMLVLVIGVMFTVARVRFPGGWLRVAAAGIIALTTLSWIGFGRYWTDNRTSEFFEELRADLKDRYGPVVPSPLPPILVPTWADPTLSTGTLIQALGPNVDTVVVDHAPGIVIDSGDVGFGRLRRVGGAETPDTFCGIYVRKGTQQVTVHLTKTVSFWRGQLASLDILAGAPNSVTVAAVAPDGTVTSTPPYSPARVAAGPHRIVLPLPYGVDVRSLIVSFDEPNTNDMCIKKADIVVPEVAS